MSAAEETRADLSCSPVSSGWAPLRIAAAPATCGVAMEVPFIETYEPSPPDCCERAATMPTPGAVRSGLIAWSPTRGP